MVSNVFKKATQVDQDLKNLEAIISRTREEFQKILKHSSVPASLILGKGLESTKNTFNLLTSILIIDLVNQTSDLEKDIISLREEIDKLIVTNKK